jgi:hypothetical protein
MWRNKNMVINDLMDLIKKLFNDEYANIVIIDSSNREMHEAERLTVKELKKYDINKIDNISADEDKIYICF